MSVVAIRKALETRLDALDGGWKVVHEDVDFNPVTFRLDRPRETETNYYLVAALLPAPSRSPGIYPTSPVVETGIFQVSVVSRVRTGPRFVDDKAEHIRRHFPRGLEMAADGLIVRVIERPSIAPALYSGPWRQVPVSVSYQAIVA